MKKKSSKVLHQAILEVVENQLRDETHPETKETFDRLITQGYDAKEAKRLIGV